MAYWLNTDSFGNGRPDGHVMVLHADSGRSAPETACGHSAEAAKWRWFKTSQDCERWWREETDQSKPLQCCRLRACLDHPRGQLATTEVDQRAKLEAQIAELQAQLAIADR